MLITNWTFNEIMTITRYISTISEIKELFANTGNDLETSVDPFITFLDLLHLKYQQTQVNYILFKTVKCFIIHTQLLIYRLKLVTMKG